MVFCCLVAGRSLITYNGHYKLFEETKTDREIEIETYWGDSWDFNTKQADQIQAEKNV